METTAQPKTVAIHSIGPDRPGIVAALCDLFCQFNCNIVDSTMTRLGPEFAMIVLVTVPNPLSIEQLETACASIQAEFDLTMVFRDITDHIQEEKTNPQAPPHPYMISVSGSDRTGITAQVARCLANHQVNVTDLNAQVIEGETGKVYIMMIEADVPAQVPMGPLKADLQEIANELSVEVRIRPIEALAL